ncbi:MAG: hypothetical protein CGW95_09400 [Phenylobacterium zucineum]|nr:MAG: hypothetical protein CGW95_09400 [Phenylobacterium zucineum]
MRILMSAALATAALALSSVSALAQESDGVHVYAGIGGGVTKSKKESLGLFQARAGVQINPYVGLEADYEHGTSGNPRLGNTFAGYVVATAPLGDFDVFGRVGYGSLSVTVKDTNNKWYSASKSEATYGIGTRYHFSPEDAVRFDVTRFGKLADAGFTLTYEHTF